MLPRSRLGRRDFAKLAGALSLVGCSSAEDAGASADAITDIPTTAVRLQTIGNCWAYTTCAWTESLHLAHGGRALDLSETYLSYLLGFALVVGMEFGGETLRLDPVAYGDDVKLRTGTSLAAAAALVGRFGHRRSGAFSNRPDLAWRELQRELETGGKLATASARGDRELVRRVFDETFRLDTSTRRILDRVFGKGLEGRAARGELTTESGFVDPRSLGVGRDRRTRREVMLADLIEPESELAWTTRAFEGDDVTVRDFLPTLHAGWPLMLAWNLDGRKKRDAAFYDLPRVEPLRGGHGSLIVDYQATLGEQTIEVGVRERDRATLAALERGEGRIEFWRLKNSWGDTFGDEPGRDPGFTDVTSRFLRGNVVYLFAPSGSREDQRAWLDFVAH